MIGSIRNCKVGCWLRTATQVYYIAGEVLKPYDSYLISGITRIIHVSLTDYTTIRNTESNEFKNRKNNTHRERSLLYRRVS